MAIRLLLSIATSRDFRIHFIRMAKKAGSITANASSKEQSILYLVGQQPYSIAAPLFAKIMVFVTAPSTNEGTAFGFVFLDCRIIGSASEGSFYLGRPWRPFAKSAFLRCEMGDMIKPEGWNNWDKPDAEQTTFFAEYKNSGIGASIVKRVSWSHQLTDEEASGYTPENILGEWVGKKK